MYICVYVNDPVNAVEMATLRWDGSLLGRQVWLNFSYLYRALGYIGVEFQQISKNCVISIL